MVTNISPRQMPAATLGENIRAAHNLKVDNIAHELGKIEEEKDIGVIIDSKLEFDKHINQK